MKRVKEFLVSLLSRKFILSVVAGVVAFGNSYFDWGLSTEQVLMIIGPLLAFVGFEGLRDIKRAK